MRAAQIADLTTQPDVIVEESHHARARVPPEHVVRRSGPEEVRVTHAVELRTDEADAADYVRPQALTVRTTNGHADDHVAHEVQHAVVAEVGLRAEEARVIAEVDFAADHAGSHSARAHAERSAAVIDAAAERRSDPRRYPAIRSRLHRREDERHRRGENQGLKDSLHCLFTPPEAAGVQATCPEQVTVTSQLDWRSEARPRARQNVSRATATVCATARSRARTASASGS